MIRSPQAEPGQSVEARHSCSAAESLARTSGSKHSPKILSGIAATHPVQVEQVETPCIVDDDLARPERSMAQHVPAITERKMPAEAVQESAEAIGQCRIQAADRWHQIGYGTQLVRRGSYRDRHPGQGVEVSQKSAKSVRQVDPAMD